MNVGQLHSVADTVGRAHGPSDVQEVSLHLQGTQRGKGHACTQAITTINDM